MPTDLNTISAWAMFASAIVTCVTAVFLYLTFMLQAQATMDQSKITRLEFERHLMEKQPLFFCKRAANIGIANSIDFYYNYELELLRNDISSYSSTVETNRFIKEVDLKIISAPMREIPNGAIEGTRMQLTYKVDETKVQNFYDTKTDVSEALSIVITILFTDPKKLKYKQQIIIVHAAEPLSLRPELA